MRTSNSKDSELNNEFQEEPSAFTEALEDAIYPSTRMLVYPETEHPTIEDIIF